MDKNAQWVVKLLYPRPGVLNPWAVAQYIHYRLGHASSRQACTQMCSSTCVSDRHLRSCMKLHLREWQELVLAVPFVQTTGARTLHLRKWSCTSTRTCHSHKISLSPPPPPVHQVGKVGDHCTGPILCWLRFC